MQNFLKKYLTGIAFFLIVLCVATTVDKISYLKVEGQSASVLSVLTTDAKPASGYAWNDNVGWINFGTGTSQIEGRVYVSNNKLYGYAWGENVGWISMNCENDNSCGDSDYAVTQSNSNGILTGYAWGENIGWINFAPDGGGVTVTTNLSGPNTLSGYAWGENIGWVSFSGTTDDAGTYGVSTDWIKPSTGAGTVVTVVTINNCNFEYSEWDTCVNGEQTRTITPDPANCDNIADAGPAIQTCTEVASTTATSTATTTLPIATSTIGITIDTSTSTVLVGEKFQFIATVTGTTTNNDVIWTITPVETIIDNFYGTISETGLYTAPDHVVNVTIIAKAKADTTKIATINVDVRLLPLGPIEIAITPATSTILANETLKLSATINGLAADSIVDWSITPIETIIDNFYGTISETGLYTAPDRAVNVTIVAKAKADVLKIATAEITVKLYTIVDGFIFNNNQELGDRSDDVANLQNRLKQEGFYGGLVGGYFGTATESALKDYQKNVGLTQTGKLDTETRTKLNIKTASVDVSPAILLPGESLRIKSVNWSANSEVTVSLHSDPIILGTLRADTNGNIDGSFDLPSDATPGEHTIQLDGTALNGSARTLSFNITVNEKSTVIPITDTTIEPGTEGETDSSSSEGGGSSRTSRVVEEIVSALNVSKLVTENVAVLGTTTEKIILAAQKIVESPTGSVVTKTITTAGVVGGGIAASSVFAVNGTVMADLLFLPFRLWGLLLSALGLKKRNRPWGTAYDSITKQPLDPAYVTLTRLDNKEENTSITDLDGRYGFLVHPGKYILSANKTNYTFPSKKLLGKTEDTLYTNLYFGEEIDITVEGAVISKNIPLDPIKFDWNEFVKGQKKLMKFYSKREKVMRIITDWVFRIGFVVSLISLFLVSAPYNLIIFGMYLVLSALRRYGLKTKALGHLTDKNGDPLSYAIIRAFDSELNVEITNKVADKIGRYYCLVNKGKYYVKVEKKNDDESYSLIYTSPVIDAKDGIINKDFVCDTAPVDSSKKV